MSAKRACLAISALAGLAFAAPAARGASYPPLSRSCVGPQAVKTMEACPGGPRKFEVHKKRGATFATAPTPGKFHTNKDLLKPHNPSEQMAAGYRDTRKSRLKARSRALLITEISGLENLYGNTPRNSTDRPQIIRRLAEDYVELESAALRDQTWYGIQAQNLQRRRRLAQAQRYSRAALQAKRIVNAARRKAIAYYTLMANQYPHYSKIDEVLYYLAYEYERAHNLRMARKVYYQLIKQAPQSPYIPNAYLAFGELFFQEAQGDPSKWALAAAAYEKVVGYPPPKNKVFGYAHYKLGYVYWNQGDYPHAINEFKKVIEYGTHYANVPNAPSLAKAARHDMIPVYAASGRPEAAYKFFRPLSGDRGASNTKTLDMMNQLGQAYLDTGHYADGITLYKDLMSRDHGDKYCFYQSQITHATEALKSGNKDAIRRELDHQMLVRKDFDKSHHSAQAIFKCDNTTADLFAETAMSWHLEAVGSGGVRGTGDQKTMDLAAYLYKQITQNFTKQEFAKFKFPRIVRADWPTLYKIRYDMADLLYFQKRWKDCGPAFDAVVAENPTGPEAAEAAYASVLCYQKMYDQMYKGNAARKGKGLGPKGMSKKDRKAKKADWARLKPKPIDPLKQGMITAFNRYICYIKPPRGNKKAEEQYVEVLYARARTYFDAQHWEEAALGFRNVALNYPNMDAGIYAAQLYLESVNVLGAHANPPRPSCFDDMQRDVPTFLKLYCSGSKFKDNEDQCELLTRIQFDIQRLKAQKTVELADSMSAKGDYKDALDKYKQGGDAYLKLWRKYCETPLSNGDHPKQCAKADEIVYDMAKAYQAGRLLAKSIQARLILLDPKYGLNKSPLAMKAIYEIGGNYQAIAAYDRAADFYERYAKATKYRGENAGKALSDATVLRLGLGDDDNAIRDAKAFNHYYGRRKPKQAAQIAFAVAAHYGQKQDWDNVRKHLAGSMHLIDRKASLDVRLQAHALLGRAYAHMKSGHNAERQYRTVVRLWSNPTKAANSIMSDTSSGDPQRRLGRALQAVGEGLFYFAEQKRARADRVKFPVYKGPGTKAAVLKHINTKVKAWIKKKRPLILAATAAYKKIVDLQPVPPPRWVIAAGARVGQMWGDFVTAFRAAPIPDSIKKDYQLRTAYYGALDDASRPQKLEAKSAYKVCLNYSVKYQYFDQFSRSCEKWLAKNYKAEYHLIDEFRDSPNRANSALSEHAYPLRIGGAPLPIVTEAPQQKKSTTEAAVGKAEKSKKRRRRR